ncbi:MAG: alpha/beta hydrolase [Chitinophagaceae bacterium]|jgi:pimeloyl-ACP methyl ester carboxylesterase|nr:MAG: alpha/beta hydrolase [Chitinophagaceae bacterium]
MQQQLLTYRDSTVNYYCFGHGPKQVLCFHGYGEDAQSFAFLEGPMGNEYSFHAIDLPFHGQTIWKQGLDFTVNDLQQVLSPVSGQLKAANSKPVLLGFSLGGRVALSLYQSEPESAGKLVLLAPDGLLMNPWYWLSTQTMMGNRLFRFTMKHPGWFFGTLKGLNKIGQVNASVSRFVNSYIGNPELRTLLYQRWTVLRKLRPDLSLIRSFIRKYETPVHLLYGKHDRIILPERGEKFRKGIEEYCTIDIAPAGHQVLQEKYIRQIKEALK